MLDDSCFLWPLFFFSKFSPNLVWFLPPWTTAMTCCSRGIYALGICFNEVSSHMPKSARTIPIHLQVSRHAIGCRDTDSHQATVRQGWECFLEEETRIRRGTNSARSYSGKMTTKTFLQIIKMIIYCSNHNICSTNLYMRRKCIDKQIIDQDKQQSRSTLYE